LTRALMVGIVEVDMEDVLMRVYFDTDRPGFEGFVEIEEGPPAKAVDAVAAELGQQLGKPLAKKAEVGPDPEDPYGHWDMTFGQGEDTEAVRVRIYEQRAYRPSENNGSGKITNGGSSAPKT